MQKPLAPPGRGFFFAIPGPTHANPPTTDYDELLASGFTDRMAARYLRVPVPEAMEGMRLARYRREVEAVGETNWPGEALERWRVAGVPWQEVNRTT